jgi:hypothetical protein
MLSLYMKKGIFLRQIYLINYREYWNQKKAEPEKESRYIIVLVMENLLITVSWQVDNGILGLGGLS